MSEQTDHMLKSIDLAGKITAMAEDGVRGLDRAVASWPSEFQAVIWDAVALIAQARAANARGNQ